MSQRSKPIAVVTGGRQGLGRGCATSLAKRGFDLVVIDLHDDDVSRQTVSKLQDLGAQVAFHQGDIAAIEGHEGLVRAAWDAFGGIDCVVNNAGIAPVVLSDVLSLTPKDFDQNLSVNLRGNLFFAQAATRLMTQAEPAGFHRSMVFITSIAANHVSVAIPEYCVSKAGLSMVAGLFALTLAGSGIQVHEVRPGFIRTSMTTEGEGSPTEAIEAHIAAGHVPMNRWGEEKDVGDTVAMLASGDLPFSVAHPVYVDGGYGLRTA